MRRAYGWLSENHTSGAERRFSTRARRSVLNKNLTPLTLSETRFFGNCHPERAFLRFIWRYRCRLSPNSVLVSPPIAIEFVPKQRRDAAPATNLIELEAR